MNYLVKWFIVVLLCSSPFFLNASVTYDLHFSPSELNFERKGDYDIVSIKGISFMNEVGKPMLPVKYLNLIIHQGTRAHSVDLKIHSSYEIPGDYNIHPAQPYIRIGEDSTFIPPDLSIYNSNSSYPYKKVKILRTGNFAGNSIATIAFYPLQYRPASGELTFYTDVTITLDVRPSGSTESRPIQRTPNSYRIYKNMLYSIVDNEWDIPGYCWKPSIVENTYTADSKQIIPSSPYIIITADSLEDAFSPFAEWLTRKGIEAHTISVSEILAAYPGGDPVSGIVDDAGSIRAFLKDGYEGGLLQWALLGGDEDIVPVRYGYNKICDNWPSFDFLIPTDLYYADIHGNWNSDMDTLFGEFFNNGPPAFTVFGKCNFPLTRGWDMKVKNNYAYVAGGKNGLCIIDLSDSTSPYVISSLPLKDSANAQAISIEGDYLHVAANNYGLRIVNISNPNYPEEIGAAPIDGI
ncbi:hypothetical protein KAW48_04075, partial [candidate division WOR-3 bacterium]|nr:hypothetical protein [candidate division WOR-3 bacterium]